MTIYEKLAKAKQQIANTEMKKAGKNSFSNYDYFTPEQVSMLVQKACDDNKMITLFSLKRNEFWEYWVLQVIDIEDWWEITVEWATAIPEIKATNVAQQIWGCMTYTERYLKMSLFWIIDNNLDFDTTENTKKNVIINVAIFCLILLNIVLRANDKLRGRIDFSKDILFFLKLWVLTPSLNKSWR